MSLVLTDDQQMLREAADDFLGENAGPAVLREMRDKGADWSPQLWQKMVELGWPGVALPEEHGGLDFGYVGAGLLLQACGRTLAVSPLLGSSLVVGSLLTRAATAGQQAKWLPGIGNGDSLFALAVDEGALHAPRDIALCARESTDGWRLTGEKMHVIDGAIADTLLVVARTDGKPGDESGLSLFVVAKDAAGITIDSQRTVDSRTTSHIQFAEVAVAQDALLGDRGGAWDKLQFALDVGAAGCAAEMLGIAEACFERTLDYLKSRKQFGELIGSFQALQHRAALLFTEIELCRSIVLNALQALESDVAARSEFVSLAKAKCGKVAQLASNEALQMHGGIGMTDEFDIGFFMKRAAVCMQQYGDYHYHADRFARLRHY